jgi:hypothetical protein
MAAVAAVNLTAAAVAADLMVVAAEAADTTRTNGLQYPAEYGAGQQPTPASARVGFLLLHPLQSLVAF